MRILGTLILVFATSPADASKFADCAVYLLSARQYHLGEFKEARAGTQQALQKLIRFRAENFDNLEFQPTDRVVEGNQSSFQFTKRLIANRLAGLLSDSQVKVSGRGDEPALLTKFYGQIISGKEEILNELAMREENRAANNRFGVFFSVLVFVANIYFAGIAG